MPTHYIEPFDFKAILIDTLLGDTTLFAYAFVIVYSYFAAQYRFSNTLYLSILGIGAIMFAMWMDTYIYVLTILIIGFIVFKGFSRMFT